MRLTFRLLVVTMIAVAACSSGDQSAVKATNDAALPPAVEAAFVVWAHERTDARGPLTVTYVQTTTDGPAEYASNNIGVGDTPIYYLVVHGTFHERFTGSCPGPGGCTVPPGNILAVIAPDGAHCDCYTSSYEPDLAQYGTPLTAVVDVGAEGG